ncbi:shkD [Gossypium arboreum]|uniref:ShkD n=1 Tax=Gossypium arboreum TaxID=29729 RepID=A0A0B0MMS6_GOSAR|nr:shkD [Gossypium arboreum]
MALADQLNRGISRQFSTGSMKQSFSRQFTRQTSLDPRKNNQRFSFGRQSSLDPIRRSPLHDDMAVPENLDATMQLLFMACRGDAKGVEDLLNEGVDVNSIDLDGRTALHIAACEGHVEVVKLLLVRKANIDARDRWGSTAAADAKYYGNMDVYNILKARGAKVPKIRKTPMAVTNPREIPEYELNPLELQVRKSDGITKAATIVVSGVDAQGSYQVAKWNGTKVAVKILDTDSFSDPETMGMNYLHECKPEPIIHCNLRTKNVLMDNGDQLKVSGFGLLRLTQISPDKAKLAHPDYYVDPSNVYAAPELYKNLVFDRSVDSYSFGVILYEMIEGVVPFHPKPPEEILKLMCLEEKRPPLKTKSKSYPPELKELIEECWHREAVVRPTFSEIIVRLNKIVANCSKQGWWKDAFKLPWK